MADFTLPEELTDEFFDLLTYQDCVVNKFLSQGKIINYALSLDNAKLWAIFSANSEIEVRAMIDQLPLTRFMDVEISLLTAYNTLTVAAANFSLN